MSFSYGTLATKATSLIKSFGRELTFTRTSKGTYNTATGQTSDSTSTFSKFCCVLNYNDTEIDGTTVQQGDRRLLSEPHSYVLNDLVSLDSKVFRVIAINERKPSTTLLSVDLQVRA